MADELPVCAVSELTPGTVTGAGHYAVGNASGRLFAVSRRCRHLGADLAGGSIDKQGCLVCPWHGARYDVETGRMVRGPQGVYAKVPGLGAANIALTRILPLRRGRSSSAMPPCSAADQRLAGPWPPGVVDGLTRRPP
jgi:nitrite reductase/ring-hydroxylating ferredoxin subunit